MYHLPRWRAAQLCITTFVTITRKAVAVLNQVALEVLYGDAPPEAICPGDPEDNLDNYDSRGRQIGWEPARLPIYAGARVTLTRNLDKPRDFVNGMSATVLGIKGNSVVVQTKTGRVLTVFLYTDEEVEDPAWRRTFLPMRLGYAATLQKLQGATLDHATIWLDVANIEAVQQLRKSSSPSSRWLSLHYHITFKLSENFAHNRLRHAFRQRGIHGFISKSLKGRLQYAEHLLCETPRKRAHCRDALPLLWPNPSKEALQPVRTLVESGHQRMARLNGEVAGNVPRAGRKKRRALQWQEVIGLVVESQIEEEAD